MILGIDEAGRGPWAGPLVVGAVVLGGADIKGLNDSKKLTKKRREELYVQIIEHATAVTGWVSAGELDELGMSAALRLATRRAVEQIHVPYHEIIIDGTVNFLADTTKGKYVTTLAKADALIPSVSAASIVAKVERDRYMAQLDAQYPGYGFAKHAGYGVAAHRAAIEQLGVTPEHRLSFAPLQKYDVGASNASASSAKARHTELDSVSRQKKTWTPGQARNDKKTQSQQFSIGRVFGNIISRLSKASSRDISHLKTTREVGNSSETAAANYLVRHGHEIITRNWKTKYCEIDIISQKNNTRYFTEVKHRKNAKAGDGLAAITKKKQHQMAFAAKLYAHTELHDASMDLRLLVIATTGDPPIVVDTVYIS